MLVTLCHLPTENLPIKSIILIMVDEVILPYYSITTNSITTQLQPTLGFNRSFENYKHIFTSVFAPVITFVCSDLTVAMHVSLHFSYSSLASGIPFYMRTF